MTELGRALRGIDTTTPNVARIYDFLLGGKDNFAADRQAALQLVRAIPDAAAIARDNRSFVGRAIRYAGALGIRQFLDLGGGLPTQANVHELARGVAPDARVVYIDNDPVVASHGRALLAAGNQQVAMVLGDLREPAAILGHPEVRALLDPSLPTAVLCTSTLHFIPDAERPHEIIAEYRDRLAPGSCLAITHASSVPPEEDPEGDVNRATSVYSRASAQLHARPLPEIGRFFDGLELVEPGLVWMPEWRPEPGTAPAGRWKSLRAGVGRKP